MDRYAAWLKGIEKERNGLRRTLMLWSDVNSYSYNREGLERMAGLLETDFSGLGAKVRKIPLRPAPGADPTAPRGDGPLGPMLLVRKARPRPRVRALLGIHMDTVFPPGHPFRKSRRSGSDRVVGPGVADAKGGLLILLKALERLEQSPFRNGLAWTVFVNPDEEIGSPGSGAPIRALAASHDLGLLFEPCFQDGCLVHERAGSGNFVLRVRGRAAHAGREPEKGRNALVALAGSMLEVSRLQDPDAGILINVGRVEGGGPVNVVPDRGAAFFNVRVTSPEAQGRVESALASIVASVNGREGFSAVLEGRFQRPPRQLDRGSRRLMAWVEDCAQALGQPIRWRSSRGASDGNLLAAEGLATVDSLGVRGGGIHTPDEYADLESLVERIRLTALLLMRLASGDLHGAVSDDRAEQEDGAGGKHERA
ncbi:MAG: hydrolase [bacterium]